MVIQGESTIVINDNGVQVISRLLLIQYLSFFMFLTLTCKSCLCLSIDQSWGGNLSGWLTAQLQPFSDIFSSVPHTQPSIQTHCSNVCHLDFSFIPVYLVPFHHTPGPQHSHNHLFTNNHLARQCLTSLYSGLFLSHTSELHAQPVEYC